MKRTCKLTILDEVNCVFTNVHPDHIAILCKKFALHPPNYHFNPKFKLGVWDGFIQYFYKTGKTYVNLLPEIIPMLTGWNYRLDLQDNRSTPNTITPDHVTSKFFNHLPDAFTGGQWEFRTYQVSSVNKVFDSGGGIILAATGAGKTSITAAIALSYEQSNDYSSIIIVPDKSLTVQTLKAYKFFGLDVGQYSGDKKDLDHKHIVSTWQALQNNPTVLHGHEVIIVDECHGLRGAVLTKLLTDTGKDIPLRFGVTGTLPKAETDAMAVKIAVGEVQYEITARELIDAGYLSDLHIRVVQTKINLSKEHAEFELTNEGKPLTATQFRDSYLPDWTSEQRYLRANKQRTNKIAEMIQTEVALNGNGLILVTGIAFGKKLAKLIPGAIFLHGDDSTDDRAAAYELFKENDDVVVIATVNIASTGLDIPRIFSLIFIDVGKSFIRVIQSIGRGLRRAPDKDFVHVLDIHSNTKYSIKHARDRIKFYDEAEYPHTKESVELPANK